ncbi:ABC transporter permease [bacterium]|nr:MAG: ABC transporter permease [bacterium]
MHLALITTTYTILKKDLKSEMRNRYVVNSLLMFIIVTISIIRFAIGDEKVEPEILSGLLWIVIFFSASSGLSRVFIKEEEKETTYALKLSVDPISVLLGKLLFNGVLTFSLNIVIISLFILITGFVITSIPAFIIIVVLGNLGIIASSTIIAAIIAKANTKGTLYPVLAFPVLMPLLITVINSTKLASTGSPIQDFLPDMQILLSYAIVVITASLLLFKFIWED